MIKRIKLKPIEKKPTVHIPKLEVITVTGGMLATVMVAAETTGVVPIKLSSMTDLMMYSTPKTPSVAITEESIRIVAHESFTMYYNREWYSSMSPTKTIRFDNKGQTHYEILTQYYDWLAGIVNDWIAARYTELNMKYAKEVRGLNG